MPRRLFQLAMVLCAAFSVLAISAHIFQGPASTVTRPNVAESAAFCPIAFKSEGSTTVFPITRDSEAPFESLWGPGTDVQLASIGSGAGIVALTAGQVESAPSSRPLTAGEASGKYPYKIALDAFVIAVSNPISDNDGDSSDGDMDKVLIDGISKTQLATIYSAGAGINSLLWSSLDGDWPAIPIIPRARITASGSQPDFISQLGVSAAAEDATISATGLERLVESSDMAAAVGNETATNGVLTYTSLANLDVVDPPPTGGVDNWIVPLANTGVGPFVVPSQTTVLNGSYPMPRQLFIAVRDKNQNPPIDNSNFVRAMDWVNYLRSAPSFSLIAAEGFVPIPLASRPPFPDWDVDLNGSTDVFDLGAVASRWGAASSCKGWIRADVNNNGEVSIGDIGGVTSKWAQAGFQCTVPANPCPE